jgi:CheY-like chemotaxis protein
LRVLVVEDEFMIAMAVEAVVSDAGGVVVEMAATLEQAVAFAETAEFDAALLDINLNGENSFPVADILGRRGIPFAFVTGYNRRMVPETFAAAPILTKPYARSDLMRILGSLSANAGS